MADFDIFSPGDRFDSRDVIERWEELDRDHGALQDAVDEAAGHLEDAQTKVEETKARIQAMEDAGDMESEDYEEEQGNFTIYENELAENEEALKEAEKDLEEWTDYEEWFQLKEFVEEAENVTDWIHGAMFIADDSFEDYAREFAEDIGAIKRDMAWPCNHIDWKAAAEQLQADYQEYTVNGSTYWVQQS